MKLYFLTLLLLVPCLIFSKSNPPLRLAVAGLSHGHVDWVFNRPDKDDLVVVGIQERDPVLVERYASRYGIDPALFFSELDEMLEQVKPDAVSAFGAISEHVDVVRACAPRGIHVMVEKPLATTSEDAFEIQRLAQSYDVQVLTNYETSWYASNHRIKAMVDEGLLGQVRKVMVNDGHEGPQEIGVSAEFLAILTDPAKNGAGALVDFGCYGANLMTWLRAGERPLSVTAVTQQNKPHIYGFVDDEATIILQYPDAQCVIQASWNWPFSRKDMEVYGTDGYAIAADASTLRHRLRGGKPEEEKLAPRPDPFGDPFSVLASVIHGDLQLETFDQYGLAVNTIVVEILEAAMRSAETGSTIRFEN